MVLVEAFGTQAVFGDRQLYLDEMSGMLHARSVVSAYAAKQRAADKFKWEQENPDLQALLDKAEILRLEARDNG